MKLMKNSTNLQMNVPFERDDCVGDQLSRTMLTDTHSYNYRQPSAPSKI